MTQDELNIVRGINFCTNCDLLPKLQRAAVANTTTIGELYVKLKNEDINIIEYLKDYEDTSIEMWTSTTTFNGTPKWDL